MILVIRLKNSKYYIKQKIVLRPVSLFFVKYLDIGLVISYNQLSLILLKRNYILNVPGKTTGRLGVVVTKLVLIAKVNITLQYMIKQQIFSLS